MTWHGKSIDVVVGEYSREHRKSMKAYVSRMKKVINDHHSLDEGVLHWAGYKDVKSNFHLYIFLKLNLI